MRGEGRIEERRARLVARVVVRRDERVREAVLDALSRVGADWVDDLPEGLDTVVGRLGTRLSPARAQQVALATGPVTATSVVAQTGSGSSWIITSMTPAMVSIPAAANATTSCTVVWLIATATMTSATEKNPHSTMETNIQIITRLRFAPKDTISGAVN